MIIEELPEEILARILTFLEGSDRLESALTCRRWAQTIALAPPLLRDVWFVIKWEKLKEAETVFASSNRRYENLRLDDVPSLEFNAAFWANVGPGLRKLELIECDHSLEVFYSILQTCSSLETLKIRKCRRGGFMYTLSESPAGMDLERIQNSMRNLRHLHLDLSVDANTLERLLILMPNVTSIALLLLGRGSDFLNRLPKILGASREITMLELDSRLGSRNDNRQLVRISSASLRTLIYHRPVPKVLNELRNCSMLRDLDLFWYEPRDVRLLLNILRNVPELESLRMSRHPITPNGVPTQAKLRREDLMPIFDLRKLRKLHLNLDLFFESGYSHVPDEIVGDISRMVPVESLDIGERIGIVDSTRFRILASMPNLRELGIGDLQWDAECVRIVLSDLGRLRTLKICCHVRSRSDQDAELKRNIAIPEGCQSEQKFSFLEVLSIRYIPFTEAHLARITAHHGRLRIVNLSESKDITDAGLVTLFQHEPLLEELTIDVAIDLDGTFLKSLAKLCRRLRFIRVDCPKISTQAVEEFTSRRPRVECYFGL